MSEFEQAKRPVHVSRIDNYQDRAASEGIRKTSVHEHPADFDDLRMLRAALTAIALPVALIGSEGQILFANAAWLAGQEGEEFLGAALEGKANYLAALESVPDVNAPARELARGIREVRAGRRDEFVLAYPLASASGTRYLRARVNRATASEPRRVVVLHEDISEQKRAELARGRAENLLEAILDTAMEGICIAEGPEATIQQVNRRGHEMLNGSSNGFEGHRLSEYMARITVQRASGEAVYAPDDMPLMRASRKGEVVRNEDMILGLPDGSRFSCVCNASPVYNPDGSLRGAVVAWRDTTEKKLLADELRQAHKMDAIGQLAGGVAHDFNNLLIVIQGYSQMLRRRISDDPYQQTAVEEIYKATERASKLTRQLLAFSRKQLLEPQVLDLNAVVGDMEVMLRRTIGEDIELISRQEPGLKPVKADPGQLEQVVLNLALNARDAMPGGGTLTLETSRATVDDSISRLHPGLSPGKYFTLAVRDTGTGMDAQTKLHIFEPFFSTKGIGKGTGLGLATVYGIVKQSGGYISVESAPGKGTTFRIYLPCEEISVAASAAPSMPIAESPTGTETILLVEDEEKVRGIVKDFLRQCGYSVLQAQNGAEALELARQYSSIDLLLTDFVMPGINGHELSRRMVQLRPKMRVLLMSGYAHPTNTDWPAEEPGVTLLQKPFSLEELALRLREVLDARTT